MLEIEFGQLTSEDIFSVNMMQNGLEKFLKFLDVSYVKVNLFTLWLIGNINLYMVHFIRKNYKK